MSDNQINHLLPKIEGRELTLRESALLYLRGTPDREDIKHLIEAGDLCFNFSPIASTIALIKGNYYSPDVHKGLGTSAALLDHLLTSAPPSVKKDLVDYGVSLTAPRHSSTDGPPKPGSYAAWQSGYPTRIFHEAHVEHSYGNKLRVLAKHGGDMNQAIISATDTTLIMRNVEIAKVHGQELSPEAGEHIVKYMRPLMHGSRYDRGNLDSELTKELFEKGHFDGPIRFSGHLNVLVNPMLHGRHALALGYDTTYKLLDAELAKGPPARTADLFYAAAHTKDPAGAIKHLQKSGLDINEIGLSNSPGFSQVMREMALSKNDLAYNKYVEIAQVYLKAGADPHIKDSYGNSAADYFTLYRNDATRSLNSDNPRFPNPFEKIETPAPALAARPVPAPTF